MFPSLCLTLTAGDCMGKLLCSDEVHYGRRVQNRDIVAVQCKPDNLGCDVIGAGLLLCGSDSEPPASRICLARNW